MKNPIISHIPASAMTGTLLCLVTVCVVAMVTGAPVANHEMVISPLVGDGGQAKVVAKRAEEMVYFGNQQNEPRVSMKKKWNVVDGNQYPNYPQVPQGEVDEGGSMIPHDQVPVDEALKERAEAIKGPSESERMEEAAKMAMEEADGGKEAEGGVDNNANKVGEEQGVSEEEEKGVNDDNDDNENIVNAAKDEDAPADAVIEEAENIDLPDSDESTVRDEGQTSVESDLITNAETGNSEENGVKDEEDIENIGDVTPSDDGSDEDNSDDDTKENSDEEVKEFLEELRHESEEGTDEGAVTKFPEQGNFPVYSNRPYYYSPPGRLTDYLRYTTPYLPLVGDRYRRRRRRSGHVRRIKRGLPSDWLAAYSGLDIPMTSEEVQNSYMSEPEDSYEYEPVNEELSRYIYGNLLNKLANSYRDADIEEEIPYEEILPYEVSRSDIPESMMEDDEPEEILYDPEYLRDSPYEDFVPSYEYRKRSGGLDYYPDSRRKRYFYPAFEEPEAHWGAFVPEKRNYNDAIQKLQRLAMALSDNPRPYYENLLREYKKK